MGKKANIKRRFANADVSETQSRRQSASQTLKSKRVKLQNQKQQKIVSTEEEDDDEDNEGVTSEMKDIDGLDFDDAFGAGLAFEQFKSYEGALTSFKAAVRSRPDHYETLSHLADVYAALEQPSKAIQTYLRASKLTEAEDDASLWFRLGITYASVDQYDAAVESYHKSIKRSIQAMEETESESERKDLAKAYCITLAALANCFGEQGDLNGATQLYRQAINVFPSNGNLHYNLATMLMMQGEAVDETVRCLERAIECDPDTIEFYSELVEFLEQNGQSEKAKPWRVRLTALQEAETQKKPIQKDEASDSEEGEASDDAQEESDEAEQDSD